MAAAEFLNKGGQEPARKRVGTADPHVALGRISKGLDIADALFDFVGCCNPTLEQCATINRRFDPTRAAVEKTHVECVLQAGNDFLDGRLSNAEFFGGLGHAATLHDREKNLQVLKTQPPTDAIFGGGPGHRKFL